MQMVAVEYGQEEEGCPSQLHVFKADHDITCTFKAPQFSLSLESAQIVLIKPPNPSPESPLGRKGFGKETTGNCCRSVETSRSFGVTTQDGVSYQFKTRDDYECQLWINMLKFLVIFPHSSLPQEPNRDITVLDKKLDSPLHVAGKLHCAFDTSIFGS